MNPSLPLQMMSEEVATVVYLIDHGKICLAEKKQNVHKKDGESLAKSVFTLNGYGGKREVFDASVRDTACRELKEESGVATGIDNLLPAGLLHFFWPNNESHVPDMSVYFFFCATWIGMPSETDSMGQPQFFDIDAIPYDAMLPADKLFLPKMIQGECVVAKIDLGKKDENGTPIFTLLQEKLIV